MTLPHDMMMSGQTTTADGLEDILHTSREEDKIIGKCQDEYLSYPDGVFDSDMVMVGSTTTGGDMFSEDGPKNRDMIE